MTRRRRGRAAVVVVGDVGRSPRMQYHALSLANQAGLEVDLIGYAGSQVHPSVAEHPRIHLRLLGMSFPSGLSRPLYLLLLPIKLIAQVLCFLWVLCIATPPPDFYLLQNPPTIPTFTVVRFAGLVRRASFVIDWHNFGFTLFGLRFGPAHPLVKIHKWYETTIARQAAAHICVTRAMQQELANNWDIRATVLYDRPPSFFRPSSLEEMREVRMGRERCAWVERGAHGLRKVRMG
ncbi:unnamed protein product [Closterium sp. NIES-53]